MAQLRRHAHELEEENAKLRNVLQAGVLLLRLEINSLHEWLTDVEGLTGSPLVPDGD